MVSRCANPACADPFNPYGGGRFFCFPQGKCEMPNDHRVKHYWLCERCSRHYSLSYRADHPEEPIALMNTPGAEPIPLRGRFSSAA